MSDQGGHEKIFDFSIPQRDELGRAASIRTAANRVLHSLDQVDYLIRHWLAPVPLREIGSIAHHQAWTPPSGLSPDIQNAIGRGLRAVYPPDRFMPPRLDSLLKEFDQRTNKAEAIARDGYASAA
jgi:hypothetical protein